VTTVKRPPAAGLGAKPRLAKQQADLSPVEEEEELEYEEEFEEPVGPDRPWRSVALMVISLLGIGVSVYVTFLHYAHVAPVCSNSGAVNCEVVLTSPQSVFLGIPVPLYGLFFFVGMFVFSLPKIWRASQWWVPWLRLIGSAGSMLFAFRLIYAELFEIRKLCLWCTSAHILAFAMFIIIVTGWEDATRNTIPRRERAN
jgi:uncharacterized membrane protein